MLNLLIFGYFYRPY